MILLGHCWQNELDSMLKQLEENTSNVKHIIFDFLNEIRYIYYQNSDVYYKIIDLAYKHDIPVTILTPYNRNATPLLDFTQPKFARINMIHWEAFWFTRTFKIWSNRAQYNLTKNLDIERIDFGRELNDFIYPYITLNNISKTHRCLVMDLLAKHNLIDVGAIAWRDINRACDNIRHTFPENVTDSVYLGYRYEYWTPKRMILDIGITDKFDQETLPVEFNQSFMQLVTESDSECVFFSEKTATPILLNKPFLVAANTGHHNALKQLGFVEYDELFDYSFDSEPNIKIRYEGLIENIRKYVGMDKQELKRLYDTTFDKLVYNKKHAMYLINNPPTDVTNMLNYLKQENISDYSGPLNMLL